MKRVAIDTMDNKGMDERQNLWIFYFAVLIVIALAAIAYVRNQASKTELGLNIGTNDDQAIINENIAALQQVYSLYSKCRDASKSNCTCTDDKSLMLENGELVINVDKKDSIKMFVRKEQEVNDIKIVSGINHCYLFGDISNPNAFGNRAVILYTRDEKLKNMADELVGNLANPLVLYKANRLGIKMICVTSSEQIARQLPGESCY